MPHRPPKRLGLQGAKRPSWNKEPDYWLREKVRLDLIESIRRDADCFGQLDSVCPGCDTWIWEARKGDMIYRGCHCLTLQLPPQHRLYVFDLDLWAQTIKLVGGL
jgi:hypothetical protein